MDAKALQTGLDVLGRECRAHRRVVAHGAEAAARSACCSGACPTTRRPAAQQLFAVLRDFDAEGVKLIWIETPPDTPEWEGVRDRLQRAAAA